MRAVAVLAHAREICVVVDHTLPAQLWNVNIDNKDITLILLKVSLAH